MIRILHFTDGVASSPWLNGFAAHLDPSQFDVQVASLGPRSGLHQELEARGLRTFALDCRPRNRFPVAIARLIRLLREQRIDVLQTHLFDPSIVGMLAGTAARTPLKIVTRHHSDFTTIFRRPVHRRIDRWQALAADRVMAASQAVMQAMVRYESVPADRITVTYYGYEFDVLRPQLTEMERRTLRESAGGDENYLIGTVGRLSIEKGHEYLLQAAQSVIRRFPKVRLVLVGDGPLRESLQQRTQQLGIADHVLFLGQRADACRVIEAMDLMVHPTLHEAFCSVIIESMALERPLIATDVAAAPEQIIPGETGILVPARRPDDIARAVVSLLEDRARAAALGRAARQSVVSRFSFQQVMPEYERYYKEWLAAKRTKVIGRLHRSTN